MRLTVNEDARRTLLRELQVAGGEMTLRAAGSGVRV